MNKKENNLRKVIKLLSNINGLVDCCWELELISSYIYSTLKTDINDIKRILKYEIHNKNNN